MTLGCKSNADLVYTKSYRCHCRQKSAGGGDTSIMSPSSIDVLGLSNFTQTSDSSARGQWVEHVRCLRYKLRCNAFFFDTHDRTVAAAVVERAQAPPAMTLLQALHSQIPTFVRLTESLPQKVQVYFECCEISIFLTDRRREEPERAG